MAQDWTKVVRYRNRAELLRMIAHDTEDDRHRAALLNAADYYRQLADRLEHEVLDKT